LLKLKRKPTNSSLKRPRLKQKQLRKLRREQIWKLNSKSKSSKGLRRKKRRRRKMSKRNRKKKMPINLLSKSLWMPKMMIKSKQSS
jgi:hypothetical protein